MTKKNTYSGILDARAQAKVPTPQSKPLPERKQDMIQNSAGGYVFKIDVWTRLDRFLVLGTEGGTYYASERKLTIDNAKAILDALKLDGVRTIARVVEISESRRAPKNDPALFVLALAMTYGDEATKRAAFDAIPKVARIGTHLFHLADYVNGMRSWGRGVRKAFGNWYNSLTPMELAQQITKYANRDGWTHADVLRLAHPKPATSTHDALFSDVLGKVKVEADIALDVAEYMSAIEELKSLNLQTINGAQKAQALITAHRLPREVVPTEFLTNKGVWEALLPHMGMEALVRNLATLTRVGVIGGNLDAGTQAVLAKLGNVEIIQKSGIHPIKVLTALLTYKLGRGVRGNNVWTPNRKVVDALDEMFYAAFKNVIPTGKRTLIGLDVSGSMNGGMVAGVEGLTPRIASAAMAMLTMRLEQNYEIIGFTSGGSGYFTANVNRALRGYATHYGVSRLNLSPKMSLNEVVKAVEHLPFGGTDCALPMLWAQQTKTDVDAFLIYTDNETWAGNVHPSKALQEYRQNRGIDAKLIVVGMTATECSIADPNDAGMMDVAGFDSAAPTIMADFMRGEI